MTGLSLFPVPEDVPTVEYTAFACNDWPAPHRPPFSETLEKDGIRLVVQWGYCQEA